MRTEGHVPGGVLLEPSVSKLLCIKWCFGDTTVQEVWFRQLMSINYIHIKLQRDIKLQTGRQTSMLFFSVIIIKQLKLVFLGESSELRSLLSPSHSISLSPSHSLTLFPLFLSLSVMLDCGWVFTYNHTETGEAKGGAAAAAAEVNKYFVTCAHLHHIPSITAGTVYHMYKHTFHCNPVTAHY